jgi:hypothetical protein
VPVAPEAANLILRGSPQGKGVLEWTWTTGDSARADFGDPLGDTGYSLCIFDKGTGGFRLVARLDAAPGGACGRRACWKSTGAGFRFASRLGPLKRLVLAAGLPGRARVVAKGRGAGVTLQSLPLAPMVVAQLRATNGQCWVAYYTTPDRNTRRGFSSRSDAEYH